jgi:Leu/Phe-tRNA-protein transferase
LVDARDFTPVLEKMGFREIPRAKYEAILEAHGQEPAPSDAWSADGSVTADVYGTPLTPP